MALGATWTAHAQTHVLRQAQAEAVHDTGCVPTRAVALSHRWDRAFPGRDGTVRYSLLLPPSPADVPHGLYFPRVGNQVEVQVGGQVLARRGTLGDARVDAAKSPLWVTVPSSLLSGEESTPLEVVVTAQAGRWGGLAAPMFGPEAELYPVYQSRYVWRQWGAVAIVFSMALVAAISGGLWRLQRDAVYGYFALGAVLGVVRFADRLWEQPPLPWPLWGGCAGNRAGAACAFHGTVCAGLGGCQWPDRARLLCLLRSAGGECRDGVVHVRPAVIVDGGPGASGPAIRRGFGSGRAAGMDAAPA